MPKRIQLSRRKGCPTLDAASRAAIEKINPYAL